MLLRKWFMALFVIAALSSCKKEEQVVFEDNDIPDYSGVSTILVENYVNKVFIDLIGREPTDIEMNTEVAALENGDLSAASRTALCNKLMFSTTAVDGTTYTDAYFRKLYDDQKARFINGVSEASLNEEYWTWRTIAYQDSLQGDFFTYEIIMLEANKVKALIDSRIELRDGLITIDEMCRRMMYNSVYDDINMGSFNFINASFDDCFERFPTESEYTLVYDAIESNLTGILFGQAVSNKPEYLDVLTHSTEFDEGLIRWAYTALLARDATSSEVYNRLSLFGTTKNIQAVQRYILISDEYAGFN